MGPAWKMKEKPRKKGKKPKPKPNNRKMRPHHFFNHLIRFGGKKRIIVVLLSAHTNQKVIFPHYLVFGAFLLLSYVSFKLQRSVVEI
jgi:hypothetical protein